MMPTALPFSSTDTTTEFQLNSHCTDTTSFFFAKKLSTEDECGHFVARGGLVRATVRSQVGSYRHRLLRRAHGTLENPRHLG